MQTIAAAGSHLGMTAHVLSRLSQDDLDYAHEIVGKRWELLRNCRIFLTGGTGFFGKWLLASLLDADRRLGLRCSVTVLTRNAEAFREQVPHLANASQVELLPGDVLSLEPADRQFSHVIHAATDALTDGRALDTFDTCVQGTRRALDFAVSTKAEAVLLVSSGAIYGRQPPSLLRMDEAFAGAPDPLNPALAYGEGKRAAEWLGSAYAAEYGLQVKIARCFAFVGPYLPLDRHFAVGNFLRASMANQPIVINGDGTPFRSYLHASDLSAWLWSILLVGRSCRAYNVGGIEPVSISQLAHIVARASNSSVTVNLRKQPLPDVEAERYVPDVSRIRSELNLPDPIGLEEAIIRTVRWHRTAI